MIETLWQGISRIANGWVFLVLAVAFVLMSRGFDHFREQYAPAKSLEATRIYKPSAVPAILEKFGDRLPIYQRQESTIDLLFPIVYCLAFAVGIVWLGERLPHWLVALPFATAFFDYCENFSAIGMIVRYRATKTVPTALAWIASIATPVKSVLFLGTGVFVCILLVWRAVQFVAMKRQSIG
ncbi:MAG TPA: hypothetical protein VJ276_18175 [Thermoanaerobaculia bacterium]|nr:hypothetical protein [Thermoanaerobaculia bacterium]